MQNIGNNHVTFFIQYTNIGDDAYAIHATN